jgi:hypothetical protein
MIAIFFSTLDIQTHLVTHLIPYPLSTRGSFPVDVMAKA